MGRIRTPWDRVAEVDPSDAGSYSGQKMDNPVETYVEAVASALPEPRPEPRLKFQAMIQKDGDVTIPASLITPVLGAVLGWWRDSSSEESASPPAPSPPSAPLPDDAIVDQRCAPVPKDLYLRLARAKAFPSRKVGKRICARWADVKAAFASHGGTPKPSVAKTKPAALEDGLDHLRLDLGLAKKGK